MPKTFTQITAANATAGNAILASDHSSAFTTLNSHTVPPLVRAKRSTNLSYTSSAPIAWDAEDYDTDAMHDNATNNTRITFATAGIYRVTAGLYVTFGGTVSALDLSIYGNGSTNLGQNYTNGIAVTTSLGLQVTALVDSATYSYVTAAMGIVGATSPVITTDGRTFISAEWVGLKA
jgi:hypothetical protein